jgi:AsmA protein
MKRALKIVGILIAVIIVIAIALPFIVNVNAFRPQIEAELTSALGRKVSIGNLSLSIISGSLSASDVSINDDPAFSSNPFIRAKALDVGVEVLPLIFSKTLHVTELTLDQPQVTLIKAPSGRWNFSSLGGNNTPKPAAGTGSGAAPASSAPAAPSSGSASATSDQSIAQNLSVGKLSIKNGQITVGETNSRRTHSYQNVDVSVKNFSFNSQFPFTLTANLPGGGSLKLNGTAGPVNPSDASLTPLQAQLNVKQLDLAKSGFVDPSSGLGGVADFDGTVSSDGHQAHSSGTANVAQLKLTPKATPATKPVALKYAVDYDLQKQAGQLTQGDVSIGKVVAKLAGTFQTQGDTTTVNMKLNGQGMPVDDLEAMLPALAVTLPSGSSLQGGTLSTALGISGPIDKLVITGPIKLADTKLAGFNMGSKLSAISALTGAKTGSDTSIQNFSSDVHYAPNGIQTQNVNLTIPAIGTLTGSGTVSPDGALDYTMSAKIGGTATAGLTQMAGMGNQTGGIPFFIRGTTSDPKFVPDVKGLVKSQVTDQLKSVLGGKSSQGSSVVNSLGGLFHKKQK